MSTSFDNSARFLDAASKQSLSADSLKVSSNQAPPRTVKHSSLEADLEAMKDWLGEYKREEEPRHLHIQGISLEDTQSLETMIYREGRKPRFDWYSDSRTAVFRMVSRLQERIRGWLERQVPVLEKGLKEVARCGRPSIMPLGSAEFSVEDCTMAPDQQLYVSLSFKAQDRGHSFMASHPRVVLETAHSQGVAEAEDKAWRYLHHSDGHCHVVIICDMTWPTIEPGTFKAVMSVWTRQQTNIVDIDYPFEATHDIEHVPLDHSLPAEDQHVPDLVLSESPAPAPTLTVSPDARVEPELRTKDGPENEKEKKIVQRSVCVLIDETERPADRSKPLELVLNVYDFLRVCPKHADEVLLDNDLVLPLEDLRTRIKAEVERLRQETLKPPKREAEDRSTRASDQPTLSPSQPRKPPPGTGRNKRVKVGTKD